MTTLANIQTEAILGDDVTVEGLAVQLANSNDAYAVENFIAKLIFAVNKYENTLVDPSNAAKTMRVGALVVRVLRRLALKAYVILRAACQVSANLPSN